jgi:hypothetical protein
VDWWAPLGQDGELRVVQLLDEGARRRVIGTEGQGQALAATLTIAGAGLSVVASYKHVALLAGDDVVAQVDFRPTPQETTFGDWVKPLHLLGEQLLITDDKDMDGGRRGRWGSAVRFHRIHGGHRSWVWHFEGGVVAGRRLVLGRGRRPGEATPVVTTVPASSGRGLGHGERHQAIDTHVTRWRPEATAAEVALVELVTVAELHHSIDRIPAQLAKELGWVPRLAKVEPGE